MKLDNVTRTRKTPELNETMSPGPEKHQNALTCNSGPNLNEQTFKI